MASRTWQAALNGRTHTLTLEHNSWRGTRALTIDGVRQDFKRLLIDTGSSHPFVLHGHEGVVRIRYSGLTYSYDIELDGRSLSTGEPASEPAVQPDTPAWAWTFVVLCALIPVVTVGGAFPVLIGMLGATQCRRVSVWSTVGVPAKVAVCSLITVGCWMLLALVLGGLSLLVGPPAG
jgi:hypothetical protein